MGCIYVVFVKCFTFKQEHTKFVRYAYLQVATFSWHVGHMEFLYQVDCLFQVFWLELLGAELLESWCHGQMG